jgi:drug/metabolite transporter (DMT)-like permease
VLFYGVGPLSVRWLDGLVPGSSRATLSRAEHGLHVGLLASLLVAAAVALGGLSGLGAQPLPLAAVGVVLAVGGGVSISTSTLLCRTLNDMGIRPATLFALRFPAVIVLAATFALAAPAPLVSGVAPGILVGVALASLALIVLPNYVNQVGVALASPITVRAVLAVGPVLVFALQLLERRVSFSPATLAACALYGVCALAGVVARRRAITRSVEAATAPVALPSR